jgi:hypothetical protein
MFPLDGADVGLTVKLAELNRNAAVNAGGSRAQVAIPST